MEEQCTVRLNIANRTHVVEQHLHLISVCDCSVTVIVSDVIFCCQYLPVSINV